MDLEKVNYIHEAESINNSKLDLCELCKKEPYSMNVFAFCFVECGGGDFNVFLCKKCFDKHKDLK
jgi:hypothetical protein